MGYVEDLRKVIGHRPIILVGSVVLLINDQDEILLQKRKEPYGVWGLPGGLMELAESAEETAKREVYEETGITVDSLELINVFSGNDNYCKLQNGDEFYVVTIAYYSYDFSGVVKTNVEEGLETVFFPLRSLPEKLVGSHRKMVQTYVRKYTNL
ncbi:NUDIX hydrolase [Cytobacillus sp. Hm23]